MTNQRDASLSSSSFGVKARMVCVDSKLSSGSSSFFTSRGAGAGAVATTTCYNDVSLFAMGLPADDRNFGQPLRVAATDCVKTGAVFTVSAGAAVLSTVGCGDAITGCSGAIPVCFGPGATAFLGGDAIACFDGTVSGLGGALTGAAAVAAV